MFLRKIKKLIKYLFEYSVVEQSVPEYSEKDKKRVREGICVECSEKTLSGSKIKACECCGSKFYDYE